MASGMIEFKLLTPYQQVLVRSAYDGGCAGCAIYIGSTPVGTDTYYWHYGASDGYVGLPFKEENVQFDYNSGNIFIRGREFTTEGEEVFPAPFSLLVHVDTRICGGEGGSVPPERVAKRLNLKVGKPVEWIGHLWLKPGELTEEIKTVALAITAELPSGDRLEIY